MGIYEKGAELSFGVTAIALAVFAIMGLTFHAYFKNGWLATKINASSRLNLSIAAGSTALLTLPLGFYFSHRAAKLHTT